METTGKILVAYADDHVLVRKSVVRNIQDDTDINVIIEALEGKELLNKIQSFGMLPNVCLIDINMKGMGGLELLISIQQKWSSIKCLVVSAYDDDEKINTMIRSGASGYLLKSADPQELIEAIKTAYKGEKFYNEVASHKRFNMVLQGFIPTTTFTDTETEFISLVCSSLTYFDISQKLGISFRSVDSIRERVFKKLAVHNKTELVIKGIELGIYKPPLIN